MRWLEGETTEVFRAVVTYTYESGQSGTFHLGPYSSAGVARRVLTREIRNAWAGVTVSGYVERAAVAWERV